MEVTGQLYSLRGDSHWKTVNMRLQRLSGRFGGDTARTLAGDGTTVSQLSVPLDQRFSNFFQVGTTFISQNVLRTPYSWDYQTH